MTKTTENQVVQDQNESQTIEIQKENLSKISKLLAFIKGLEQLSSQIEVNMRTTSMKTELLLGKIDSLSKVKDLSKIRKITASLINNATEITGLYKKIQVATEEIIEASFCKDDLCENLVYRKAVSIIAPEKKELREAT